MVETEMETDHLKYMINALTQKYTSCYGTRKVEHLTLSAELKGNS